MTPRSGCIPLLQTQASTGLVAVIAHVTLVMAVQCLLYWRLHHRRDCVSALFAVVSPAPSTDQHKVEIQYILGK